jgi:hypothetical protein
MGGAKHQMEDGTAGLWHSSAADYKESLKITDLDLIHIPNKKANIKEINRNYMKKWSKEEDKQLMDILDKYVEQDKIIKYDDEFRMEFGRTEGALSSRFKKLIFENYDESCWEDLIKAAAIRDYDWERYVYTEKKNKEHLESQFNGKYLDELNKIKKKIDNLNQKYHKNFKLTS